LRSQDRYYILILFSMTFFSYAFAVESSLNPHFGNGQDITLSFWETNGSDILRVYLLPCMIMDSGIECEDIRESRRIFEGNISGDGSISIDIASEEGLYKICIKLKESDRQDCDKDNYYMLYDEGCVTYQVVQQVIEEVVDNRNEIEIDLISAPSIVFTNTSFISCANITNLGIPKNVTGYSYLYNGSNCITGSWLGNSRNILLDGNFTYTCFENEIEEDPIPGEYKFKIRIKWNDTDFDSQSFTMNVEKREFFDLELVQFDEDVNGTLSFTISNKGNIPTNMTIIADSEEWTENRTFLIMNNSITNLSVNLQDYKKKLSVFFLSDDVIFDHLTIYNEENMIEKASFDQYENDQEVLTFPEESFLYGLLSLFTLASLSALVWNVTKG
jgi:hypothetical protein